MSTSHAPYSSEILDSLGIDGYPYILAGLFQRIAAALFDFVICVGLSVVFAFISSWFFKGSTAPTDNSTSTLLQLYDLAAHTMLLLGYLMPILYILFRDGLGKGQSYGKRLMKIRVMRANGQPCDFGRSLLRNLLLFLGSIDWGFLLTPKRQRLGDRVASTYVIKDKNLFEVPAVPTAPQT